MRKFLLSTIALMMSVAMMAVGAGNGTSKANAIDFDWANGHKPALSAGSWYRVSLSPLKAQANDPTLALYLTNLTDETAAVSVTVEASLLGQSSSSKFNYNIAGKDYQLWSKKTFTAAGRELSLKQMMDLGLSEIYLQLTANKEIALSAKVYETEDIVDDACSKAKDFDWAGVSVPAGEQWYRLNLAEVKMANKQLKFVVANNGVSAANVAFDMSLDCPASAVIEKDWVIAAGAEQKDELGRVFLDVLNEDYVFVKLTTNQPLTLSVEEEVVVVDPDQFADFDCASAPELVFDEEMNLTAGKHVYKVRRAELIAERDFDTEFHVTNNTDAAANLAVEVAFACPVKSVVTQNLVIDAHESIMKLVKGDMLKAVNSEWVYIRFVADQDLTATVGMRNVSPCVNALPFDWNVGAALNAGESQWYDVDITSLKQNKQHVRLSFTNHSDAYALVNVEVALDCNGTILPMTLPIPAGLTVSQTIDYQLLARSPLNRIYVGVSTDSYIELAASTKDAIAADQTPCLNAIAPEHGVEYTHEANTTQWYKISLDLLKSTTDYSSIYLANKGNSRAHVTVGMVTDCQYTTGTTLTIPVPAGLEVGALAPNVLGRLIQELTRFERAYNKVDAKDVYLEIHSDQPLAFGLDVVNKATNPCLREDLITFDWNKGAKVVKGEPKWFDMDIDAVKAAGKHVKLTFTNHTDSIVWAATVVSAECPAKLTMPLLVPVPAGMSVDKVINYQLFAVADIHNIYIGVMTDGALELKAESTDATILPPADCLTAKTVVSGEEYVQQAGTQWYQFPMSLIDEMGKAASISFKNMTSKHATLTAGVTIGCDYAAATVAKVKVPRDIEFTLNVPKLLLSKVRGLVDPAITSFYLQLTTDQAIAFSLNTQAAGVNACASAVEFDWTAWETDGLKLKANEEQWYKVNIAYPLEKLKNGEDITLALSNPNLMPVEVDLAVSPTCPVVLSLEKSVTIPAGTAVSKTLSYDEVMKLIAQYDKYDLADRDFGKLMEQINVYVLYNKLVQVLEDRGYDKYLPLDKIDPVVNKYGESASLANLKELVENYDKYLTVAELKSRLEPYKEKVSIETLLGLIDKYGDYIPYVDAQQLIDNADVLIPYIGTATAIVDKCKQYISKDDLKQLVERIKSYVPFEEMKKLTARLEKYLPEKNTFYVYVKASGDLEINPGAPIEPDCSDEAIELTVEACESYEWHGVEYTASGDYTYIENVANCEDAEWLDWKQPIKLSEFTAPWYKLDVSEIITNESDFSLTLVNDLGATVQMPLELHYYCSEDGDGFIASDSREIAEGTYTREIPYALFDEFIGPEYETIYLHNVNADCDRVEVLHLTIIKSETTTMPIEYATICEGATYDWRGNTYSVSDTIVVEEALECGTATYTLVLTVKDCSVTPQDPCENAELVQWDDVIVVPANADKWYKVDYRTALASGKDIEVTLKNGADNNNVEVKFSTECFDPNEVVASAGITVKAKVPASWTDQIYVWVWPTGGEGHEEIATKDGDWWTYTHQGADVNILFKEGTGWKGLEYQTVDMSFTENACVEIEPSVWGDKATYTVVECDDNVAGGATYNTFATSFAPYETQQHTLTQADMAQLGIVDYVYAHVTTTGEFTVTADTIDTPVVPECEDTYYEFTYYFCGVKVSWDGVIYDQPGDYTHKYLRADGCYDVVTMHLIEDCTTPCTPVYTEFDAVFCGEYNWNGTIYTAPGDYEQTLTAVTGCDSIVTMHLTEYCPVTPECENVYTEFSTTFCGSFTWNGVVYTEAGDYVQTLSKTDGCDSIVTLHLEEDCQTPPVLPENPCLNAIPFDWTVGAFLAAGEAQWYEMDITSLIENKQHLMLNFINHSDENAWINVVVALDCEGKMVPVMLPVLANMNVDQTIDYQILKRSPEKRIYVGVYTKEADIELKSAVRSAIATDQTPCLNATEVQYNETYVHEPGTSWYKVSVDLLKNNSDALGFYFANKGNKHALVTVGMVADCYYTTGTTITLPIPSGVDFNVLAPNLLKVLMQEVESFEEKLNDWDVQEIYVELTSDQTIEFALKAKDGNYDCESAIDFDWADWEANGIQLQADQDVWYRMNMEYPIEKLLREEEVVIAITNLDSVAVDVEMIVSPTCPVVVSVDKAFSVPARTAVKKTLSYADAMQWLSRHDAYLPYDQIQLFVDKYGDHLSVAELKNMLNNYEKYISVEQLKQELAKHKDYVSYETVEAALAKYGKYIPYVDAEALLKKYEDELLIAAGYAVVVLKECDPYITAENFWQVVDYCKPYIPVEELKHLLEIVEKHLTDYTCYLRVKTTGDLYVGPKPLPIPCDDVLVEETVEACGQYEWKGVLYTVSGDYTFTQPLADPANAEFLDWKQPIKLSEFTAPWYKVDVTEVIATHSDFTLLIENDLNETQEVTLALHDAMAEFLLSGSWKVATGVHPKTVTFEEFEQIVDPEHKVLYLHNVNYDCERTEVLHLTIKNCDETITAAVCDGTVYVDPITNVEHLISSLVPSTLTWTETVLTANKEKTTYTYVITPIVAPAALTAEVLATIPGATPVLTPGLMPNVAGTAEAIKAYYESIDTESISDVVTVSWETAAVACGATSHTMTLVVEDDCDNIVKAEITLEVAAVEPVEETVTACDSYEWNGETYTVSGDYEYTTTNANGCDSVVILHLTINKSEVVEETVTACDSYEWNGQTYTESGDYTFNTVAANGCDRTEILHLTINTTKYEEVTVVACDSYEWNGETYTESVDKTFTTVATNGCDSVVTLHLTITKSEVVEETVTACDSYTWNGETYTESGDYVFNTTTADGCERVETLHLTINKSATAEETVVTCDSYEWNGETYTESGDYVFNTTTTAGCDSVVTLHLTILPEAVTETEDLVICESEFPYLWRNQVLNAPGTYEAVEQYEATSCDSVIHVLNLQVYALTLPTSVSTPIAVCGHTVDVSKATTEIEAHIAANLYAQNVTIVWEVWEVQNAGGAWLPVADVVLNGTDEAVTVRYTINSDCGSTEPVVFDNVPVEMPNPSNDVDMDNISAISKYGNRIILLNLNAIQAAHGWIPEPEDVMWYRVVNGLDVYGEPGDDEFTGKTGHYFNYDDATSMTGQYYALIVHNNLTNPNECEMYMRTEVITCSASGIAPRLMPNVARPNELLTLTNLNSADVTEIRVYSASGELLETYVADQVPEFIFNAAHTSGFYMVDVQTQDNKVTLRYIVK